MMLQISLSMHKLNQGHTVMVDGGSGVGGGRKYFWDGVVKKLGRVAKMFGRWMAKFYGVLWQKILRRWYFKIFWG